MESLICFRILIIRNFGNFEIKISKCNRTLDQPGILASLNEICSLFRTTQIYTNDIL